MKLRLYCCLAVTIFGLFFSVGCSEGPIKTVPVYGKITFADRNAPERADLVYQPLKVDGPLRPSFSVMEPDGSYRMKAFERSKGLIPGKYRIIVTLHDAKPGGNLQLESGWKTTTFDAGEVDVPAVAAGLEHDIEVTSNGGKKG